MKQNIGGMLKTFQQMQARMGEVQKTLAATTFEGAAAQGLVKVKMLGTGEITRVDFDPSVLNEGAEVLGDLVTVASRVAHEAKEAASKKLLLEAAGGALPFGMKIPGLG